MPLAVEHVAVPKVGGLFFIGPHETEKTQVWKGHVTASLLNGPSNLPLHEQKIGKLVVRGEITLRGLRPGYEYSRELSQERTLYFRIDAHGIEAVPASEGRHWKVRRKWRLGAYQTGSGPISEPDGASCARRDSRGRGV